MPAITRLEAQVRRQDRVNVYLDGAYAFSVALDAAAGLRPGQVLDDADIARLKDEDRYREAWDRALGYLGSRPRSRQELTTYLAGKDVAPEIAARVLDRLEAAGLVDDAAFAAWWVENRLRHRPRGTQALRHELAAKGVARATQAEATAGVDEGDLAHDVALAEARRYRGLDRATFDRRLGGLLARRGFGYEAIRPALDAAWAAGPNADA